MDNVTPINHRSAELLRQGADEMQDIRHVMHFYGYAGGVDGGDFIQSLLKTITLADLFHRARLWKAYPRLVNLVAFCKSDANAEAKLRARLEHLLAGGS